MTQSPAGTETEPSDSLANDLDAIVQIWRDCLESPDADPDSHLVRLGGTSLTAGMIAARVGRRLRRSVRVKTVLQHPTPALLLAALSATDRGTAPNDADTGPAGGDAGASDVGLTAQQQAIWFLERLAPEHRAYNSVTTVRYPQLLDIDRLHAAADAVVRRHEILRTRFPVRDGRPVQEVMTGATADVTMEELLTEDQLRARLRELGRRHFDTTDLPLITWHLFPTAGGGCLLAQVEHHFVHDGWSSWLIITDLADAYRGATLQSTPSITYRDFAAWQARWLDSAEARRQCDYWVSQLSDVHGEVRLGDESRRPDMFTHRGDTHRVVLTESQSITVGRLAAELDVTPFTLLWTVFGLLVGRWATSERYAVGTTFRNRPGGLADTVGMFVNAVGIPFPDRVASFRDVVREAARALADAHDNQEIPLAAVVRTLARPPELTRNPVFQVCFSANDWPDQSVDFGAGAVTDFDYPPTGSKFDLDVVAFPPAPGRGWLLLWRYYTEVLTTEMVTTLAESFETAIATLASDADQPTGSIVDLGVRS